MLVGLQMKAINIFQNSKGKTVIFQKPNTPLIIWLVCTITQRLTSGNLTNLISLIGFIALFYWANLEVLYGASYFRKILGFVVIVFSLYSRLK